MQLRQRLLPSVFDAITVRPGKLGGDNRNRLDGAMDRRRRLSRIGRVMRPTMRWPRRSPILPAGPFGLKAGAYCLAAAPCPHRPAYAWTSPVALRIKTRTRQDQAGSEFIWPDPSSVSPARGELESSNLS